MTLPAPGEAVLIRAWRWTYGHLLRVLDFYPSAFTLVGAAGFAAASLTSGNIRGTLFIGACVFSIAGLILSYANTRGARRIQREWDQEKLEERVKVAARESELNGTIEGLRAQVRVLMSPDAEIASFLLERVLSELDIDGSSGRASLYSRDESGQIILLARYSRNARYRLPGSGQYQLDEGAVARGWEKPYLDNSLPIRRDHWNSYMRRNYGIPEHVVPGLRMQSRSLATVPLFLPQGATTKTVGVLMVEHLDPDAIDGGTQDALSEMPNLKALGSLCQARNLHAELCL